ncbi:MAG: chemotaxis protein CheW [Fusobacteriota bacterium]
MEKKNTLMNDKDKYLTFSIKNIVDSKERKESYGISIQNVQEIMGMLDYTPIPKTPDYIKGVINLRGKIITIIDLRLKLGFEEVEYNDRTCIIIVELEVEGNNKVIGFIVDIVSEVIDIGKDQIEEFSQEETDMDKKVINGIAKLEDKIIMILDLEKLLSKKELSFNKEKIEKDVKEDN